MSNILQSNMDLLLSQIYTTIDKEDKSKVFALKHLFYDMYIGRVHLLNPISSEMNREEMCMSYELLEDLYINICICKELEEGFYCEKHTGTVNIYIAIDGNVDSGISTIEKEFSAFLYELYGNDKEELSKRIEKCLFELL